MIVISLIKRNKLEQLIEHEVILNDQTAWICPFAMMDAIAATKENVKLTYDDSRILHNCFSMKIKHTPVVVVVDVSEDDFAISAT